MFQKKTSPILPVLIATLVALCIASTTVFGLFYTWQRKDREQSPCRYDGTYAAEQWNKVMGLHADSTNQGLSGAVGEPGANRLVEACIQVEAKAYIDTDYGELKDLGKAFLTLILAAFIASVTFSEKIINFQTAPRVSALAMFTCWTLLLVSVFSCGVGLVMNLSSLYSLKYAWEDPWKLEWIGVLCFMVAGVAFALGLTFMLIAALPMYMPQSITERLIEDNS